MQLTLAPLVGAIAGGNCVVVKPGSYAVESSHAMARAIAKHLDPSCIRVVEVSSCWYCLFILCDC